MQAVDMQFGTQSGTHTLYAFYGAYQIRNTTDFAQKKLRTAQIYRVKKFALRTKLRTCQKGP